MKISVLAGVALLALSACHSSDEFSTDAARAEQASEAADAAARSNALNEAVKADADSHEEVQDYRLGRLDNEMAVDSAANADARLDALENDLTNLKTEIMEVKAEIAAQKTPKTVAPITAKPASVGASKKASKPDS